MAPARGWGANDFKLPLARRVIARILTELALTELAQPNTGA